MIEREQVQGVLNTLKGCFWEMRDELAEYGAKKKSTGIGNLYVS